MTGAEYLESIDDERVIFIYGDHELYEINYSGSTEEIRRYALFGAIASRAADRMKGFPEQCMAEYDLDGWTAPDLVNLGEASYHAQPHGGRS